MRKQEYIVTPAIKDAESKDIKFLVSKFKKSQSLGEK